MLNETPNRDVTPLFSVPETIPAPNEVPAPRKPWTFRNLLVLIICAVLALLAANILVIAGYAALQPILGWPKISQAAHNNPFLLLALQSIFHALIFLTIYLFIVVNHRLPFWEALMWRTPDAGKAVKFFLGGIVLAVVIQSMPPLLPDRDDFPLTRLFTSPQAGYAIAAFAILVAPFMEELIFRGVLFSFFQNLVGDRFAVLGTAALFAALHVPEYWGAWNHVFLILVVGLVFSAARGVTGSLAPSVILHVAYNTSLMTALFIQTKHFRDLQVILTQ